LVHTTIEIAGKIQLAQDGAGVRVTFSGIPAGAGPDDVAVDFRWTGHLTDAQDSGILALKPKDPSALSWRWLRSLCVVAHAMKSADRLSLT
jgi:hypothetical protein